MAKTQSIKARISETLDGRVQHYLKQESARGLSISESDVVVRAVVEYLDRQDRLGKTPTRRQQLIAHARGGRAVRTQSCCLTDASGIGGRDFGRCARGCPRTSSDCSSCPTSRS